MKNFMFASICTLAIGMLSACSSSNTSGNSTANDVTVPPVALPQTIQVIDENAAPVTGMAPAAAPAKVIKFGRIGDRDTIRTGETVNIAYEGVNQAETYLRYEQVDGGYTLQLAQLNEPVVIQFEKLCQRFIVANPAKTTVRLTPELRFEQVVWTPREDGSWEARIGTIERGCKSEALDALNKLRGRDYEKSVPRERKKR